ncbi:hypothetical protein SISSUDRAFT_1066453 [Sistotremastrum suecicum HHB10207 ss-3]|uniref:Uncharacterized protein n=1 Tax=Sistotremastrum suecicum HHB10207 ss-3 TaxID=1314776 RepID=A0A165YAW1_9AGAM|nr:hypothetical protein SISSUDRAFT_1066453 [Sistotremastrum suecicum HHB10207 ss-3]
MDFQPPSYTTVASEGRRAHRPLPRPTCPSSSCSRKRCSGIVPTSPSSTESISSLDLLPTPYPFPAPAEVHREFSPSIPISPRSTSLELRDALRSLQEHRSQIQNSMSVCEAVHHRILSSMDNVSLALQGLSNTVLPSSDRVLVQGGALPASRSASLPVHQTDSDASLKYSSTNDRGYESMLEDIRSLEERMKILTASRGLEQSGLKIPVHEIFVASLTAGWLLTCDARNQSTAALSVIFVITTLSLAFQHFRRYFLHKEIQ